MLCSGHNVLKALYLQCLFGIQSFIMSRSTLFPTLAWAKAQLQDRNYFSLPGDNWYRRERRKLSNHSFLTDVLCGQSCANWVFWLCCGIPKAIVQVAASRYVSMLQHTLGCFIQGGVAFKNNSQVVLSLKYMSTKVKGQGVQLLLEGRSFFTCLTDMYKRLMLI